MVLEAAAASVTVVADGTAFAAVFDTVLLMPSATTGAAASLHCHCCPVLPHCINADVCGSSTFKALPQAYIFTMSPATLYHHIAASFLLVPADLTLPLSKVGKKKTT